MTGLTSNFSPISRMAPPPLGRERVGAEAKLFSPADLCSGADVLSGGGTLSLVFFVWSSSITASLPTKKPGFMSQETKVGIVRAEEKFLKLVVEDFVIIHIIEIKFLKTIILKYELFSCP